MKEHIKDQKKWKTSFSYSDLPLLVKKSYTKNQDNAWKIHLRGKKGPKGFSDRLMRAQNNIDFSIELLIYLTRNDLLDEQRKELLSKVYIS
jgi:hypothetical protein